MKTKRIVAAAVILLGLAAAGAYTLSRTTPQVDVYRAARGPIEEIVTSVSAGTVKSRIEAVLSTEVPGLVEAVSVREGDTVARGAILIRLSDPELSRQIDAKEAEVVQAEEQLRQAEARRGEAAGKFESETARAAANLRRAREEHRRAGELFRQGFLSKSELEQAETALANAQEDARTASLGEITVRGIDREIASQKARLEAARAGRASFLSRRNKMTIAAPFAGVVTKRTVEPGEVKLPGAPLLVLADPREVRVDAEIDESESARVRVGQPARLYPEAYKGTLFSGRVSEVRPTVEVSKEVSRANTISVMPLSPPSPLRLGMSVDVEVVVGRKEDVLLAPSAAVMERDGAKFVYAVRGGRIVRRDITTGVSNWEKTEVLSGVAPGEEIVTSLEIKDLAPGVRVDVRNRR